jgi:hypothetical protein
MLEKNRKYSNSELETFVTTSKNNYEIGGELVNNEYLYDVQGQKNIHGRKFLMLRQNVGKTYWHTHPRMDGFWPSWEDILRCVRHETTEKIFTRYIVYTMKLKDGPTLNKTSIINKLRPNWKIMNNVLTTITQRLPPSKWDFNQIRHIIELFKIISMSHGLHVTVKPIGILRMFLNDTRAIKTFLSKSNKNYYKHNPSYSLHNLMTGTNIERAETAKLNGNIHSSIAELELNVAKSLLNMSKQENVPTTIMKLRNKNK